MQLPRQVGEDLGLSRVCTRSTCVVIALTLGTSFLEDLEKKAQSHGDIDPELVGPPLGDEQDVIAPRPSMSYEDEPPTSAPGDTRRVQIIAPRSETDSGRATPSAQLVNPFSSHTPRYVADSSGRPCKSLQERPGPGADQW